MQDEFRVYGRDGEPCPRCGTTISKTRVGGRGTWFCPRCQPLRDDAMTVSDSVPLHLEAVQDPENSEV
jgi:ribosomal protein L37AE/L43A